MRFPLLAMWFLFFVGSPALAQPITIQPGEPPQALSGDEDGADVSCTPELLPFIQGVERVEEGGVSHCVYQFIRHLRVGSEMLSLVMVRYASEHEEHSFLHESVALLDAQGRVFATVTQLDIEQHEELSRIRIRRFRRVSLRDDVGNPRPGICIETVEERGPGSFTVWSLERRGRPWIPRVQHRAVDAWLFDFNRAQGAVRLIRRSALDGLCPARGYARFVEGDTEDLGAVEARRVVGEVALADDAPETRPAYAVPWRRGQRLRLRDVRRAFPGHRRYWLDSVGYENSPDTLEPIVCVGDDACRVRIGLINPDATDEPGRRMGWMLYGDTPRFSGEVLVRDGSIEGPDGIRVGASYSTLASSLENCVALYGDFMGMTCRSIREPSVFVQLQGDGFAQCDGTETPCSEALASARVVEFNLARR